MIFANTNLKGRNRWLDLCDLNHTMKRHRMTKEGNTRLKRDYTIRTCAEAKVLGLKQYFTGQPCKHGHLEPRATVNGTCLECVSIRHANWRSDDPEHARQTMRKAVKAYYERNPDYGKQRYWKDPETAKAASLARQRANPEAARKRRAKWKSANPHKVNADAAKRRAALRNATPPWLTEEHWRQIEEIYLDAATRPGGPWHVDHIMPLIHDSLCGLHVPWNLRVITAQENWSKNNRVAGLDKTNIKDLPT